MRHLILFRLTPAGEEYARRRLDESSSPRPCPRCGGERVPFAPTRPAALVCPACTRFAPTREGGAR